MQNITKIFFILVIIGMLFTGCGEKLVTETCIWDGEPAAKNYTNPQQIDLEISRVGDGDSGVLKLKARETVAVCDKCYGVLEIIAGKSK